MRNKSFEGGWTNQPVLSTVNQIPESWGLTYIPIGNLLRSHDALQDIDHDPKIKVARTIPECVHKGLFDTGWNLPVSQRPGEVDALVLDGVRVYKVFSSYNPFGVELTQEVNKTPGSKYKVNFKIRVHYNPKPGGDGSPGAAVWRVGLNDTFTNWKTFGYGFKDREWVAVPVEVTVPENGVVRIFIHLESRSEAGIDFFLDNFTDEVTLPDILPDPEGYPARAMVVDYGYITDVERRKELYLQACERGIMVGPSHDHVRAWPPGASSYTVELYDIPKASHQDYIDYYAASPKIKLEFYPKEETPPSGEYTYPVVEKGSKLHPHAIGEAGAYDLLNYLVEQNYTLPFIKVIASQAPKDLLAIRNLKQLSPNTKIIARVITAEGFNPQGWGVELNPETYMSYFTAWAKAYPEVEWWELWNEQDPPDHVPMAKFAVECMKIAEREGYKLALMSYSTGTPEFADWVAIADQTTFFQQAKSGNHILSLHAYSRTGDSEATKNHLLRPIDLYEKILEPRNLVVPFVHTEYSIDESSPGVGIKDWDSAVLMQEYAKADELLSKLYYCLGASVYTFGQLDHYSHNNLWRQLADTVLAVRDRKNATPEFTPELPPPTGGLELVDVRNQLVTNPNSPWYPWRKRTLADINTVFVHHSAGVLSSNLSTVKNIAAYHTSPTGKNRPGICYTYIIGADGTTWYVSDIENVVFSQGSEFHPGDENLFGVGICLLGNFTGGKEPTPQQMNSLENIIEYLNTLTGRTLRIWGHKDVISTQCPGDSWPWKPEWGKVPTAIKTLVGFNDHTFRASKWMIENGLKGFNLVPLFLGGDPTSLDFSKEEASGIRVIVNLRYSWSVDKGGAGTLPILGTKEATDFINASITTIRNSKGVWGWEIGNEYNNPREFPQAGNLTPQHVIAIYNTLRSATGARMTPGALDPYNAEAGDPRNWLIDIFNGILGAEFIAAHGYVRGPVPENVNSDAKFTDDPLKWQYLNYPKCITALLEVLPPLYRDLDIYVTEFNHLYTDQESNWGWVTDERAAEVIKKSMGYFKAVAIYRWSGDEWAVENNSEVLNAVREVT